MPLCPLSSDVWFICFFLQISKRCRLKRYMEAISDLVEELDFRDVQSFWPNSTSQPHRWLNEGYCWLRQRR